MASICIKVTVVFRDDPFGYSFNDLRTLSGISSFYHCTTYTSSYIDLDEFCLDIRRECDVITAVSLYTESKYVLPKYILSTLS
jgi:hypothetical protein